MRLPLTLFLCLPTRSCVTDWALTPLSQHVNLEQAGVVQSTYVIVGRHHRRRHHRRPTPFLPLRNRRSSRLRHHCCGTCWSLFSVQSAAPGFLLQTLWPFMTCGLFLRCRGAASRAVQRSGLNVAAGCRGPTARNIRSPASTSRSCVNKHRSSRQLSWARRGHRRNASTKQTLNKSVDGLNAKTKGSAWRSFAIGGKWTSARGAGTRLRPSASCCPTSPQSSRRTRRQSLELRFRRRTLRKDSSCTSCTARMAMTWRRRLRLLVHKPRRVRPPPPSFTLRKRQTQPRRLRHPPPRFTLHTRQSQARSLPTSLRRIFRCQSPWDMTMPSNLVTRILGHMHESPNKEVHAVASPGEMRAPFARRLRAPTWRSWSGTSHTKQPSL